MWFTGRQMHSTRSASAQRFDTRLVLTTAGHRLNTPVPRGQHSHDTPLDHHDSPRSALPPTSTRFADAGRCLEDVVTDDLKDRAHAGFVGRAGYICGVMAKRRSRSSGGSGFAALFGVLLIIGLIAKFFWWLVGIAAAVGLFFAIRALVRHLASGVQQPHWKPTNSPTAPIARTGWHNAETAEAYMASRAPS